MNCLPVFFFLLLLNTEGEGSYPPEGADCQSVDRGFPVHWLQQDGQCCRCYEGIVMCQEFLPCPQLPKNVDGCDIMDVCGCDWLICNETQNEEGKMGEEGGVIKQGEGNEVEASSTQERRKREVIENPPRKVGNRNSRIPKVKGGAKGSKAKGGSKGNKGKGTLKGSKGKAKGAKGKGKGLKGTGNVKGKGKGSKGKGKGGKGGFVPTAGATSTTSTTTPKGDNGNPSYDYSTYTDNYSYDYNYNDYTYGNYIYTDYTYNQRNDVTMKEKVKGKTNRKGKSVLRMKGKRNSSKGETEHINVGHIGAGPRKGDRGN